MSYRVQIGELDISEEAEELREFLYDIVSSYPSGIDSNLLENLYKEQYVKIFIDHYYLKSDILDMLIRDSVVPSPRIGFDNYS